MLPEASIQPQISAANTAATNALYLIVRIPRQVHASVPEVTPLQIKSFQERFGFFPIP